MSSYLDRLQRRNDEWAVKQLVERGRLDALKSVSTPEMRKRIENTERRLKRREK